MDVSLPAFAHLVTGLGATRNIVATSAGVSSGSASVVVLVVMAGPFYQASRRDAVVRTIDPHPHCTISPHRSNSPSRATSRCPYQVSLAAPKWGIQGLLCRRSG